VSSGNCRVGGKPSTAGASAACASASRRALRQKQRGAQFEAARSLRMRDSDSGLQGLLGRRRIGRVALHQSATSHNSRKRSDCRRATTAATSSSRAPRSRSAWTCGRSTEPHGGEASSSPGPLLSCGQECSHPPTRVIESRRPLAGSATTRLIRRHPRAWSPNLPRRGRRRPICAERAISPAGIDRQKGFNEARRRNPSLMALVRRAIWTLPRS
jgi:hypothetical protein